jgi:hypothetical protein
VTGWLLMLLCVVGVALTIRSFALGIHASVMQADLRHAKRKSAADRRVNGISANDLHLLAISRYMCLGVFKNIVVRHPSVEIEAGPPFFNGLKDTGRFKDLKQNFFSPRSDEGGTYANHISYCPLIRPNVFKIEAVWEWGAWRYDIVPMTHIDRGSNPAIFTFVGKRPGFHFTLVSGACHRAGNTKALKGQESTLHRYKSVMVDLVGLLQQFYRYRSLPERGPRGICGVFGRAGTHFRRSSLFDRLPNHMLSLANGQCCYEGLIFRSLGVPVSSFELKVRDESANEAYNNQSTCKNDNSATGSCLGMLGIRLPRLSIEEQLFIVLILTILFGALTCFYLFRSLDTSGRVYYWRFACAFGVYVIGHAFMWLMASWIYCALSAPAHSDSRPLVNVSSLGAPCGLAPLSARLGAAS